MQVLVEFTSASTYGASVKDLESKELAGLILKAYGDGYTEKSTRDAMAALHRLRTGQEVRKGGWKFSPAQDAEIVNPQEK